MCGRLAGKFANGARIQHQRPRSTLRVPYDGVAINSPVTASSRGSTDLQIAWIGYHVRFCAAIKDYED